MKFQHLNNIQILTEISSSIQPMQRLGAVHLSRIPRAYIFPTPLPLKLPATERRTIEGKVDLAESSAAAFVSKGEFKFDYVVRKFELANQAEQRIGIEPGTLYREFESGRPVTVRQSTGTGSGKSSSMLLLVYIRCRASQD